MTITHEDIPFTLLPYSPDWSVRPRQVTIWDTEIEQALRGYETRGQMVSAPRPELSFAVSFSTPSEYGEFCNLLAHGFRVDHSVAHLPGANVGTGQFAVPWAGRESWVQSFTVDTVTIDPTPWPWAVWDWCILFGEGYCVAQVAAVAGNVLTLASLSAPLAGIGLGDGNAVMPLFFGRLEAPGVDVDSPVHTRCELKLTGTRYVLPVGVPPACANDPEWPNPPACTPPVAVATKTELGMVVSFSGVTSLPGTSPADGVTAVPLVGYGWEFGDGASAVGAVAEHEYLTSGVFHVVLTVRDALARYDEAVLTVTIAEPGDPYGGGSGGVLGGGL